jgi:hypothetical protein
MHSFSILDAKVDEQFLDRCGPTLLGGGGKVTRACTPPMGYSRRKPSGFIFATTAPISSEWAETTTCGAPGGPAMVAVRLPI